LLVPTDDFERFAFGLVEVDFLLEPPKNDHPELLEEPLELLVELDLLLDPPEKLELLELLEELYERLGEL
jgi:hypothetical protein